MDKLYNRLVIIGNGFDKAIGLKTSYAEFIIDYLKKSFKKEIENQRNENSLIHLNINGLLSDELRAQQLSIINSKTNLKELIDYAGTIGAITFKYDFFRDLISQFVDARWVDIEQYYYETLKGLFQNNKNPLLHKSLSNIIKLNECMDILKGLLNNYIKEQQVYITNNDSIENILFTVNEPIRLNIARLVQKHNRKNSPTEILFLNFNYTNTIEQLLKNSFVGGDNRQINIHGTVNNDKNPIIFGYGDDTGNDYKELELSGENELLRIIKSFQYPRTHNYHNLLNYLEPDEFDVFIIGHSCGLSDRTLLKTIFEHPNCLAIQIFHYKGEPEHFEKRMEISRHFSNKALMRERVLPFDEFATIPQIHQRNQECNLNSNY